MNPIENPTRFDETWVRQALSRADMNVLRVALYQQTKDPDLLAMKAPLRGFPGTPYEIYSLPSEARSALVEKAIDYLMSSDSPVTTSLSAADVRQLLEMFEGKKVSDSAAIAGYEELSFEGFKRSAEWTQGVTHNVPEDFEVFIIGAGFSSIIMAIQLDHLGIKYRIVERQAEFGGTWTINTYPDARVDITSFIYNFSFETDYPWEHAFAPRNELNVFVEYLVDKYGIREHAEFNTRVEKAVWDEATAHWIINIVGPDGHETVKSNVLLSCSGLFNKTKLPDIKGIESFKGKMFHTTEWDHDYDYKGKRVALIGTGSTGSQLLPKVAPDTEQMTVYQRTPNWIANVGNYRAPINDERRWLLEHMPGYANWNRYSFIDASVRAQCFQNLDRVWQAEGGRINEKNDLLRVMLTNMVKEKMAAKPELIPHLIPTFAPLSRRMVIDNGFYETLLRDNVALHTDGISHMTEKGIVDKNGVEQEYDLIILAAGFEVERYLHPVDYIGRNNISLDDLWSKDGARAYLTMTLPGFPNFFMMYGPNAAVRAGGFHSAVEMFSRYICGVITTMIERDVSSVELKKDVYVDYNKRLDEGMKQKLWEEEKGGNSYYLNKHGKSGVNMPWDMFEFYDFIRKPEPNEFVFK